MIQQVVTLYTSTYYTDARIHAVEGDTDRQIVAVIGDYEIPASTTAKLHWKKPDGTRGEASGTVDRSANTVTVDIDDAITQAGRVDCQIKMTTSGNTVSTYTFGLLVQKSR